MWLQAVMSPEDTAQPSLAVPEHVSDELEHVLVMRLLLIRAVWVRVTAHAQVGLPLRLPSSKAHVLLLQRRQHDWERTAQRTHCER